MIILTSTSFQHKATTDASVQTQDIDIKLEMTDSDIEYMTDVDVDVKPTLNMNRKLCGGFVKVCTYYMFH